MTKSLILSDCKQNLFFCSFTMKWRRENIHQSKRNKNKYSLIVLTLYQFWLTKVSNVLIWLKCSYVQIWLWKTIKCSYLTSSRCSIRTVLDTTCFHTLSSEQSFILTTCTVLCTTCTVLCTTGTDIQSPWNKYVPTFEDTVTCTTIYVSVVQNLSSSMN